MSRATKLIVFGSMLAALALQAGIQRAAWTALSNAVVVVFVAAFALSTKFDVVSGAAVLGCAFVYPAVWLFFGGVRLDLGYTSVWLAALLGTVGGAGVWRGWNVPGRWRIPLVLWALTVAAVWPVVVLREIDFSLETLHVPQLSVVGPPGIPPELAIAWVLNVALTTGVGILWFDWLCGRFAGGERQLRRTLLVTLAASWAVTTAVGIYQLFVDMSAGNSGLFAELRRASGAMFDANPFGVVAALGAPIAIALGLRAGRFPRLLVLLACVMSWLGLWASGSRTALAAGVIGTGFGLAAVLRARGGSVIPAATAKWRVILPGVVAVALIVLVASTSSRAIGPLQRVRGMLPDLSLHSLAAAGRELWTRNEYGTVAVAMIREHPLFGVGIGAFHFLEIDYSRLLLGQFLPFDNAQNWFRHQLVELGLVGSVGWILWTVTFGWFVIRRSRVSSPPAVIAARGAILAVVAVSLVGMPTQNTALAIAFWTLAFWFVQLEDDGATLEQRGARSIRPLGWAIVWAIVAVAAAGTVYSARHSLRLPFRAARFDWPFSYGFYARETGPAGSYQWVGRYGVTVLDATQPWMRVTVAANHVDLEHKPVIAEVSIDRVSILTATLRSSAPVVRYVHLQPGARRVVLEARASRVVRPQDYGGSDPRQLGAMIGWEFVSGRGD